jgi:hypothetical protein
MALPRSKYVHEAAADCQTALNPLQRESIRSLPTARTTGRPQVAPLWIARSTVALLEKPKLLPEFSKSVSHPAKPEVYPKAN